MFDVMRRSYVQRGLLGGTDGIAEEDLGRLDADRELLAGWVILLDRTLLAMDAAKAAAESGSRVDVETLVAESLFTWAIHGWGQAFSVTDGEFSLVEGGSSVEFFDRLCQLVDEFAQRHDSLPVSTVPE